MLFPFQSCPARHSVSLNLHALPKAPDPGHRKTLQRPEPSLIPSFNLFFLAVPHSVPALSSSTRDGTQALCSVSAEF